MKRLFCVIMILCFYSPLSLFAETVVLKSGKTIEGKILEKTDECIKIDFYGVELTYWLDEVDSIDGTKVSFKRLGALDNATAKENKCVVHSKENVEFMDEGEKIVFCLDSIRYINSLYKIAVILPAYWSKIHINERNPEDVGKITSIAFSPADGTFVLFHIIIKKSERKNIQDAIEDALKEKRSSLKGYKLESESVKIKDLEAVKISYSSNMDRVTCYLFFNDGFVYELSLGSNNIDDYQRYSNDFEKIIKTILFVTESESSLLQNNNVEFVF